MQGKAIKTATPSVGAQPVAMGVTGTIANSRAGGTAARQTAVTSGPQLRPSGGGGGGGRAMTGSDGRVGGGDKQNMAPRL